MCDKCRWEDYKEKIEELMNEGRFSFALDTLEGILGWVESNSHITEKQVSAIENIERGGDREK